MSSFFSKKIQHICVSLDVNFNESLTNDIVSFEQLGPDLDVQFAYSFVRKLAVQKFSTMTMVLLCKNVSLDIHQQLRLRSVYASTQSDQCLLLSANRIIGHYRMVQRRANAWMRLCACAGYCECSGRVYISGLSKTRVKSYEDQRNNIPSK